MITISKIEDSLHDMGWTKEAINFIARTFVLCILPIDKPILLCYNSNRK